MITIRDKMLAPYEIDVDKHNFILVKRGIGTESGKPVRKTVGYYSTLKMCLSRVVTELVNRNTYTQSDLDGQVVTLKQFLQAQTKQAELVQKMYESMAPDPAIKDDRAITPKQILEKHSAPIEEENEIS